MVETGQRAQLGNFNRTNRNILDIERCERENDGFVTVFPFHSFLFGIIYIKIYFLVQIEKTPQRVFKTFFKLMVILLPFYFFVSFFLVPLQTLS